AARESDAAFARAELERQSKLLEKGFVSREGLEAYERDLKVKDGEAAVARAQLRLLEVGARPEEIAALEAERRRAEAELKLARQRLEDMSVIRAPIDGVVVTPKFQERLHERVAAGDLVCELAGREAMRAELFVPERELDAIQVGLPVTVKVAAYPTVAFEGKVALVGAAVEQRAGADGVRVVAEISDPGGLLRPQMTGYGEVRAERRPLLELSTRRLLRWVRVRFLI
ncbi:MAG TPA: efflux RND transporter periplasmic adaptor subunit, partial [Myxococcales bacterium]|nr:efflux RND transporter periplasmic adaptor subunit [Myxococcales bacterium]